MQFGVPIAYKTGGLSLAVTPIIQYGNLDINYDADFGAEHLGCWFSTRLWFWI